MPRYISKSSENTFKKRKCSLPKEERKSTDGKPCKEFCDIHIGTAIIITPRDSIKKLEELHKKGFWFFQTFEQNGKLDFTRRLVDEVKEIIKNELFWKGGKTGLIAQKPKSLDEIKREGYAIETYYHATDPSSVADIIENGLLSGGNVNEDLACNCGEGIYVADNKIDAIDWGLVLLKEGHLYDKPVILEIKVPSFIAVSEDPNPIEKDKYPLSMVLCTKYGIPKDFIEKYVLDEEEKIHLDMEHEYIMQGTEYEDYE